MAVAPSLNGSHRLTRVTIYLVLGVLLLALLSIGSPTSGQAVPPLPALPGSTTPYSSGELLVQFQPGAAAAPVTESLTAAGGRYVRTLYGSDVQLWEVPAGEELALVEMLGNESAVAFAEPNYSYSALDTTPNDPRFSEQWAHQIVNSEAGWDISTGSAGIIIAIIDTGVDLGHPDLASKLVSGYDFVGSDPTPSDLNGHGTHVAGIAGAATNNGVGVAGVDWQARIMPIRVLDADGSGYSTDIVEGINWAAANGADILNMSLGGTGSSSAMQNAVSSAHANGILVIAAMGNYRDQGNPTIYPAAYPNVLAVSATAPDDTYAFYSQYGSYNDVAAPGGEMSYLHDPDGILSTMPTYGVTLNSDGFSQNYDHLLGTSMATPMVAGLAGLILSKAPSMSPDQVQGLIEDTAVDLGAPGWDPDYGHGRINVAAAMQQVAVPDAPTLNPITNLDGDGNYTVSWNSVVLASGYELQEDADYSFGSPTVIYSGPNTSFPVAGSPAGFHYYRVRATSPNGASPWSNVESTGVAPDAPDLSPISNPAGEGDYVVDWNAPSTATWYELHEDDSAAFGSPVVRYLGPNTDYEVTGQAGGDWYYRVRAGSQAGTSAWSNVRSTSVDPAPLAAPDLLNIANGDGDDSYTINWTTVISADNYILEESASSFFVDPQVIYSGSDTSFDVSGQSGGTWYYRVRAQGDPGLSPWSNSRSATVTVYVYLPLLIRQ